MTNDTKQWPGIMPPFTNAMVMVDDAAQAATQAATDAIQAMTDLVVHAAMPVLIEQIEQGKAQIRRELKLHFGIVDKQDKIIAEQRRTIRILAQRIDQLEAELAQVRVDLGIECLVGRQRDESIRDLEVAHNTLVGDLTERLDNLVLRLREQQSQAATLFSEADDRDRALTESESRIADLEKRVFPTVDATGLSDVELFRMVSDQIAELDRSSLGARITADQAAPDAGAFSSAAGAGAPEQAKAVAE